MHIKKVVPGVVVALSLAASPCIAGGDDYQDTRESQAFYATLGGGLGFPQDIQYSLSPQETEVNSGFSLETGFGYRLSPDVRVELTYGLNKIDVETTTGMFEDADAKSVIFSGYYDLNNSSSWTPYIGLGLGRSTVDSDASVDDTDTSMTYQGKAGLTFEASEKVDVFGEVGFQAIEDTNINNTDVSAIQIWKGQVGVRFFF